MSGTNGLAGTAPYQTISFSEVPATWRVPGTYVEVRANYANQGLGAFPARALIIGQMLATGSATPGTVYPITRTDQPAALFGAGSTIADMLGAFLAANPLQPLYALGLSDPTGGAAAASFISIGGASTQAGTFPLYIAGTPVPVSVSSGMSAAQVVTAIVAAVNAYSNLPVKAVVGTAATIVQLNAKHLGVVGNSIGVAVALNAGDALPAGITISQLTAMTGGTGTPNLTTALADIASEWYTDIVIPWTDSTTLALFTAELASRYQAMSKLDAHGWIGLSQTYATLLTTGNALNSQFLTVLGGQNLPQPPWVWAASAAAVGMFNLTNDPSRQLRGKPLPGIVAPAAADQFTAAEQENLLFSGISTFKVARDGTVSLSRVITTYQLTPLGVDDAAWLDVMTPKTLTRIRYDWRTYIDTAYAGVKLAPDDSIAAIYDATIATPRRVHNAWAGRTALYEQAGWIENGAATAAASSFQINANDKNRLDSNQQVQIIGNLIVSAVALEFQV